MRRIAAVAAGMLWGASQAATAFGQQAGDGTTIVYQQRTPYVEALVVAALCGAALFAVCRSSRRN